MKRKTLLFIMAMLSCYTLFAQGQYVNLPKGTFYLDNTNTGYSAPKFVYGNAISSTVEDMTLVEGNVWKITHADAVSGVERYFFSDTQIPAGVVQQSISSLKDDIALTRGEHRTATSNALIMQNTIFTPEVAENWNQGTWSEYKPTPKPVSCNPASGKLPVLYVYTEGGADIVSKDDYIQATFYLDAMDIDGYESVGSKDAQFNVEMKGRGNYTWSGFDKKPYAFKMDKKRSILGSAKEKNFTLLAHADDNKAFLRNFLGFRLSELFGLAYTPFSEPVELIINDEYKGLYFFTDKIKISPNRVNITEQTDGATDPSEITGGWLLEIDNYWEDASVQFQMMEKGTDWLLVTSHSPEVMSQEQYSYMYNYLKDTNDAIHEPHGNRWESYIDIESLVDFYLVQEVLGDHESFHGSCYMHKERGTDTKLIFGPVWDFGSALDWPRGQHIYDNPTWGDTWIDDLAEKSTFKAMCQERWLAVRGSIIPELRKAADAYIDHITPAAACDLKRWPSYGNDNMEDKKNNVMGYLSDRMQWLDTEFGTTAVNSYSNDVDAVMSISPNPTTGNITILGIGNIAEAYVTDLNGRQVQTLDASATSWQLGVDKGAYIVNVITADGSYYNAKVVVR